MKLSPIRNNLVLICLCILINGCDSNSTKHFLDKTEADWKAYLSEISDKNESTLKNTVFLVLKSSECSPALKELKTWNEFHDNNSRLNVKLIILERYATTAKVLLDQEGIKLPTFQDSTALVLRKELLPATPMKVFINEQGKVSRIAAIDSRRSIEEFLSLQ